MAFALVWFLAQSTQNSGSGKPSADQQPSKKNGPVVTEFSIGEVSISHPAAVDESNSDPRFTRFEDGVTYWHHTLKLGRELHQEGENEYRDLEIINEILGGYRLVFGENPVGTDNEEFASALAGENAKNVVFIDPNLLVDGQLLDRFGSPYVFHPLKADVMGLRSPGKDGQLWTKDDVALDHQETESELGMARDQ